MNTEQQYSTAILVPTCSRYEELARMTARMIDRYWQDHPEILFCGSEKSHDESWLRLLRDPGDWIGIAYDACEELEQRGIQAVYLILDDHPPLGPCHRNNLNMRLPSLLIELKASMISLNGWCRNGREGRYPVGEIYGKDLSRLERVPDSYTWKYSLHPALWNLQELKALLGMFMEHYPLEERNPWLFERQAVKMAQRAVRGHVYRVCGSCMTANRMRSVLHNFRLLALRIVRRFSVTAGQSYQDAMQYYEGPYPLYWSGIMSAGQPNVQLIRYLEKTGRSLLGMETREVVKKLSGKVE